MSPKTSELAALRKVSAGEVTVHHGGYEHTGRPISGELAEALVRLRTAGHLTIGAPGPGGHRPVTLTDAGVAVNECCHHVPTGEGPDAGPGTCHT